MECKLSVSILLIVLRDAAFAQTVDCNPAYSHGQSSMCSATDRNQLSYLDLSSQLLDANGQEHLATFVLNTTLGMYQFLHPCVSTIQAALELFFGASAPDSSSGWWNEMAVVVGTSLPLVGRRRRAQYINEDDLLKAQLQAILRETGNDGGCIQLLIDTYQAVSAQVFRTSYPNFRVPTTTPAPTTPVTFHPIRCTVCDDINCILSPVVTDCSGNQFFCYTGVEFTFTDRQISRGCASQAQCQTYSAANDPARCAEAGTQILPQGTACRFCCLGDGCNDPPRIVPDRGTLYP